MTIVAAVKCRDGLVLGTDSMTHVIGVAQGGTAPTFLKAYANATKLFQLGNFPIAVATWGAGNVGTRSIGGLILEHGAGFGSSPKTIEEAAQGIERFIGAVYDAAFTAVPVDQRPALGFFVGGYSQGQPLSELWEVRFPQVDPSGQRVRRVRGQDDFGANWRGIELPFTRLHFGFDPRAVERLVANGVDRNLVEQIVRQFESPVIFDSMPVQDAVHFAEYILRTTIQLTTFEVGVPSCGEPLQVAVILAGPRFLWVQEPRFRV